MEVRNVMGAYYVRKKTNLLLRFIRSLPGVWSRKRKREKNILRFTHVLIINRFECPYEKDVNKLFAIQEIAYAIHMAFLKAYAITKSNDTVYDTDFVEGKVNEIITLYNGSSHSWNTKYPIEEKLPRVERLSIVPIRNVDDVYAALKDGDTLAKILEQGLEEQYLSWKESIVKLFMSVKDKIKKEDLTIHEPTCAPKMQKGLCIMCQGFANIHCINCERCLVMFQPLETTSSGTTYSLILAQ